MKRIHAITYLLVEFRNEFQLDAELCTGSSSGERTENKNSRTDESDKEKEEERDAKEKEEAAVMRPDIVQ